MPLTASVRFQNVGLRPAVDPSQARTQAVKIAASQNYAAGVILGELTGNNEFQLLSISGVPTGGTFTLTFGGQTTAGIAYNAEADAVRTALEALSSLGVGYVRCTGGPLPNYPVVIEFVGPAGNINQATITHTDSLTGGSSPAAALTVLLDGAAGTAGTYKQTSKAKLAAPTAGPTLAHSGADGSLGTGAYLVAYSYVNANGETPISPPTSTTPASTNHISVTTITPPSGAWVRWYMSDSAGSELRWFADNNGTGFNILLNPPAEGKKPVQTMGADTVLSTQDGSQIAKAVNMFQVATDSNGLISLSTTTGGDEFGATELATPAYFSGCFNTSDLVGLTEDILADFRGHMIRGSIGQGGIVRLP